VLITVAREGDTTLRATVKGEARRAAAGRSLGAKPNELAMLVPAKSQKTADNQTVWTKREEI